MGWIDTMDEVELLARKMAATKMGLIKDPEGRKLPNELWEQCLPRAQAVLRGATAMANEEDEKLIREQIADVMEHRSVNANGTMIFTLTPAQRDVIVKALRDVDFLEGQLDAALYAADDR